MQETNVMHTFWQRFSCAAVALSCMVWFAATLARAIITYDLYQPATAMLRALPHDYQLEQLRLAENLATIAWISYALVLCATVSMLLLWRTRLHQHGYIAIAGLLILVSLLWQGWIAPTELSLYREFPSRWQPPPVSRYQPIMDLVGKRFFRQSPADLLNLLTAAAAIVVLIIQPRRRTDA
ncbi:MAG: hypothetical protein KatS3mg039_0106 [Candidatus Kapaibacterium sp.]|nr:MAG: hypothetical protein KatS3mg039_0106 [Candidatus Kapabacteria bacterium]